MGKLHERSGWCADACQGLRWEAPVLEVIAFCPCNGNKIFCRKNLAGFSVHHEHEASAAGVKQQFSRLPLPGHIDENVLHDLVVVPAVMRFDLVGPLRGAGFRVSRPNRDRPFVVAGAHVIVPNSGIASTVIDEVEFGVVGDPAPDRSPAHMPLIRSPRTHAQIFALIFRIKRLEVGADEGVFIGAAVVSPPQDFSGFQIKGGELSPYSKFAAAVSDQYDVFYDNRAPW